MDSLIQSGLINAARGTVAVTSGLDVAATCQQAQAQNIANAEALGCKHRSGFRNEAAGSVLRQQTSSFDPGQSVGVS